MNVSHIVYAGDNTLLAFALAEYFNDLGCKLTVVPGDCAQAIHAIKKLNPSMVFIGLELKGEFSAEELALAIEQVYGIPVVLIQNSREAGCMQNPLTFGNKDAFDFLYSLCDNATKYVRFR